MFIYRKIAADVAARINACEWRIGDRLPPERELMRSYNISDTTMKKALRLLAEAGIIEKRHGSGNYVTGKPALDRTGRDMTLPQAVVAFYGQLSGHALLGQCISSIFSPLKKYRIALRKFQEDITPGELILLQKEFPGTPIVVFNSRNQTAQCAARGLLRNLEELSPFPEMLEQFPANLRWKFAGGHLQKHYYGCPYTYTPCAVAVNMTLAGLAGLDMERPPRDQKELFQLFSRFDEWKREKNFHQLYSSYSSRKQFMELTGRSAFFMAMDGHPFPGDIEPVRHGVTRFFNWVKMFAARQTVEFIGVQSPDPFVSGNYLFSLQAFPWLLRDRANFYPDMDIRFFPMMPLHCAESRYSCVGSSLLSVMTGAVTPGNEALLGKILMLLTAPDNIIMLSELFGAVPAYPAAFRKLLAARPEYQIFFDALFNSLEPHFLYDSLCEEQLNVLSRKIFADPDCDLRVLADKYVTFYTGLLTKINRR